MTSENDGRGHPESTSAPVVAYIWAVLLPTALGGILVAGGTWWFSRHLQQEATVVREVRAQHRALLNLRDTVSLWLESIQMGLSADNADTSAQDEALDLAEGILLQVESMTSSWLYESDPELLTGLVRSVGRLTATLEAELGSATGELGKERLRALRALRDETSVSARATLEELVAASEGRLNTAEDGLSANRRRVNATIGGLSLGYLVLVLGLLRWSLASLVQPVRRLTMSARRALRAEIERIDTLGSGPAELRELSVAFASLFQRLHDAKSAVEEQVRERTAELVAANRSQTEFLANMSHEIRTPMTAILGFVDALMEPSCSDEERREFLDTIHRNGTHLLEIINDILDLSKLEVGRMEVERIECSPALLLSDTVNLLRGRAGEKGLELELEFTGAVPRTILSDPTRLRQITFNLVGNAIKFTERGAIRVRCGCRPCGGAGECLLRIDVEDTGIGIPEEKLGVLFDPFTQVDTSHTRSYGGSGLGLAISQKLARTLGGDITVESEVGRGSLFRLELPLASSAESDTLREGPPQDPKRLSRERPEDSQLRGRVLLAEDGVDNRRLISRLVQKLGLEVDLAENGRIAVQKASAAWRSGEPYDVILMDIQMPELDGYGATLELRDAGYRHPIIAITAHAMTGSRERCLAAGCNEFLTKPINKQQLRDAIVPHLEKRACD